MGKIIKLGKIDYLGIGKKTCPAEVEIELRDRDGKGPELSICGTIWNHKHTDCYSAGQCLDTIAKYIKTEEFAEIYRLWHLYHLNGFHPGTEAQEAAIEEWKAKGHTYNYTDACYYLEEIGLLEDNGYRYGHSWLYRAIPENDLEKIKNLIYNN